MAEQISSSQEAEGAAAAAAVGPVAGIERSAVRQYFEAPVLHRVVERKVGMKLKKVQIWVYRCKLCSKSRQQEGSSTGSLSDHLRKQHPDVYLEICHSSKHTSLQMRNGELVSVYSFKDKFFMDVMFVVMCVREILPFHKARREGFREFTVVLNKRYTPPCDAMCKRLLQLIVDLMIEHIAKVLLSVADELGEEWLGSQFDLLTGRLCRSTFEMTSVTFVDVLGKLHEFVLSASEFEAAHHNAANIKAQLEGTFNMYGIMASWLSPSPTVDGDKAGKKAIEDMGRFPRVCGPHNIHRSWMYGTGQAGKEPRGREVVEPFTVELAGPPSRWRSLRNSEAKALIQSNKDVVTLNNTSRIFNKDLHDKQLEMRGPDSKVLLIGEKPGDAHQLLQLKQTCLTRWHGDITCMGRNGDLEPELRSVFRCVHKK